MGQWGTVTHLTHKEEMPQPLEKYEGGNFPSSGDAIITSYIYVIDWKRTFPNVRNLHNGADHMKYLCVIRLNLLFAFNTTNVPALPCHTQLQFEANYSKHVKPLHESHEPQTRDAGTKV